MMKIYTYHKARGDIIGFNVDDPDIIYISILFSKNKWMANGPRMEYPNAKIIVGGPGYDPTVKLPYEIEGCAPDHNLYPNSKYSFGRVTSGCPRKCPWCIVPKLEPNGIRFIQNPKDIWKKGTILRLLDDNILASPEHFWMIHDFCLENKVKLDFEYLDIRFITPEIARGLKELKHYNGIWFGFDMKNIEKAVINGIKILKSAGFGDRAIHFLVYCEDENMIPDAMQRWEILRDLKVEPFLMINIDKSNSKRMRRIQQKGQRPGRWRGMSTEEVFK